MSASDGVKRADQSVKSSVEPSPSSSVASISRSKRRSPLQAVRAHCLWCCDGNASEVAQCPAHHCPLWLLRSGRKATASDIERNLEVTLHPSERAATVGELHGGAGAVLKAIRRRCIDCSGGSLAEVRLCKCEACPLHPFRLGKNPNIRLSPERKAQLVARLRR